MHLTILFFEIFIGCSLDTVSYLSDESILCKADKIGPGRVVDILKDCGSFDPGSSPGRGVKKSYV